MPFLNVLLNIFLKIPFEKLGGLVIKIVQRRILLVSLLCLFFFSAVVLSYWYYLRSSRYDDIVVSTLGSTVEPTPQIYKGLESFLLSEVDQSIQDSVKHSPLNTAFVDAYTRLYKNLINASALLSGKDTHLDGWRKSFPAFDDKVLSPTLLYVGGQTSGEIFKDTWGDGSLFVPLDIIRDGPSLSGVSNFRTKEGMDKVNKLIESDTEIKHDVILSRVLAEDIKSLLHTHMFDDKNPVQGIINQLPAQVYLVSGTGLNRIFSNSVQEKNSADEFYATQFGHLTYFPGRPYFTGALELPTKAIIEQEGTPFSGAIGDYFYVSHPYMDLAGNGLVLTISRRLVAFKEHPIVLCMDFSVSGGDKDLDSRLKRMVNDFSPPLGFSSPLIEATFNVASTGWAQYVPGPSDVHQSFEQSSLISSEMDFISSGNAAALAEKLSDIKRIDDGKQIGKFDVSVPISVTAGQGGSRSVRFLLFRLDLAGNRRATELVGLAGCTCFAFFSILLIAFAATSASKSSDWQNAHKDLDEAFEKVGGVLWDAAVPYALLGSNDKVSDCNKAMASFLGYAVDELKGRRFKDLIEPRFWPVYEDVTTRREGDGKVDPYKVAFVRKDGSETNETWIASAAVPRVDHATGKSLPETFGILLQNRPEARLSLVRTG